jgi:hypothetical protein
MGLARLNPFERARLKRLGLHSQGDLRSMAMCFKLTGVRLNLFAEPAGADTVKGVGLGEVTFEHNNLHSLLGE